MKKKIFGSLAVLIIAAITAFNVNINSQEEGLSDVSLANVEALASETLRRINCSTYPIPLVCWWLNGVPMDSGYAS